MSNSYVEIHDPISNQSNTKTTTNCDHNSTSHMDSMADTEEYKLLRAYARRRRPKKEPESPPQDSLMAQNGNAHANGPSSPQTLAKNDKEKKKRRPLKRLWKIFPCVKPQIQDDAPVQSVRKSSDDEDRCLGDSHPSDQQNTEDEFDELARRLTQISDEIPFTPPEIEDDAPIEDESVEKVIGLILRDAGDRFNDEELKNAFEAIELSWNYSFFKKLIVTLLRRMGLTTPEPDALGPQASPKTQIAVMCEVTSRLSAVDTLPMSQMLSDGARFLQEHYAPWIQQQGGLENAFDTDDEDEVH